MKTAAEQLRSELALLPHQTSAAETLLRDAERIVSGEIGGAPNTIIGVLWPGVAVPPEWWRTPLGMFCAADRGGGWRARRITQAEAAAVLGVTGGTVATLCHRGTLQTPILLGEVLDRLVRIGK